MRIRAALLAAAMLACATRHTPRGATRNEVIDYVRRAADVVAAKGPDACATLQRAEWFDGEWYIFVLDGDGRTLCHPARPELVGNRLNDLVDANGKRFGDEFMTAAAASGGWVDYVWPRPGESTPTPKSSYVISVRGADGKTYVVGSGGHAIE